MRALLILIVILLIPLPTKAEDRRDPDLGLRIAEGVANSRVLWLRGSNGVLVQFDRTSGERTVLATDAIDILADDETLWVLSGAPEGRSFTVRDLRAPTATPRVMNPDSPAIALVAGAGGRPGELTTDTYLRWNGDRPQRTTLPATLRRFPLVASDATGVLYAGYNLGEWGGGLRRIDPATGTISFVSEPAEALCGGRINPACEPVVGLFRDRRMPECVIVGTGLSHMGMSFGRVYRVCGDVITTVYTTPVPATPDRWMFGSQTWPLEALVETSDGWIGVSRDRYFINVDGEVTERPMPAFENWSGLRIAEADGALFIVAACCWGASENPTLYRTLVVPVTD